MLMLSLRGKALLVMLSGVLISPGRILQPVFSTPTPVTQNKDDRKAPPCTFGMGGAGAVGRGPCRGGGTPGLWHRGLPPPPVGPGGAVSPHPAYKGSKIIRVGWQWTKRNRAALEEPHGEVFALLSVFNLIPELPQMYIHIVRIGRSCCQKCC